MIQPTKLSPLRATLFLAFIFNCSISTKVQSADSVSSVPAAPAPAGDSGSDNAPRRILSGSAKDKAEITPSVRLVPPTPENHILNRGPRVEQFNGQAQSVPGSPFYPAKLPVNAFVPQRQAPHRDFFTPVLPARIVIERPHIPYTPPAPPKWNYTMTPRNGIMTWSPGYQITHVVHPVSLTATGASASGSASLSQNGLDAKLSAGRLSPGTAAATGTAIQRLSGAAQSPPAVAAMAATPQLLTEVVGEKEKRSLSWKDWYERVCNTIYRQWILDAACPGKACVRVTVWSSRDIEARVLSFTPAEGMSRDAVKETAFREVSLRAINSLQKTEMLDFPISPARTQVIFDLDMNRSVNGPSGCVVAAFHDSASSPTNSSGHTTPEAQKSAKH